MHTQRNNNETFAEINHCALQMLQRGKDGSLEHVMNRTDRLLSASKLFL